MSTPATQADIPPDATVGQVIDLLRTFDQDLPFAYTCPVDGEAHLPTTITVTAADYGQLVQIS